MHPSGVGLPRKDSQNVRQSTIPPRIQEGFVGLSMREMSSFACRESLPDMEAPLVDSSVNGDPGENEQAQEEMSESWKVWCSKEVEDQEH